MDYKRALNITDHFPEIPRRRDDCIELLELAGYYGGLQGKPYSKIGDQGLFRAAQTTKTRAESIVKKQGTRVLADVAAVDNVYHLYATFNFDSLAEDAPELDELVDRLWRE